MRTYIKYLKYVEKSPSTKKISSLSKHLPNMEEYS